MKQLTLFSNKFSGNTFNEICKSLNCTHNVPGWPDVFGDSVSQYLNKNNIPKIKTLSLFSGAGGLDIGFSDVGFDIVESVEIEHKFCETLEINSGTGKRFENSIVNCIDIRQFFANNLGKIDFIIGGPPCQTFSAAGRRVNGVLGTNDSRGILFREYVRLLKEISPAGFLFENVYGIVSAQSGKPWQEILDSFSKAGYKLYYRILDAADYGVPQHRERLFIVGLKDGKFKFPRPTHGPDSLDEQPFYNAGLAVADISGSEENLEVGGRYGYLLNEIPPGLNYSFYTEKMGHPHPIFAWRSKFSDFLYKADPYVPVRTIKASGGAYTGPFHWENRRFSYSEFKRLQSFPDDYVISGRKQVAIKQIGNSVPPQIARIMAIAIRTQVFHTKFPFNLPLLEETDSLSFRKRKRELTELYREKAAIAIANTKQKENCKPNSRTYFGRMSKDFCFRETSQKDAEFFVSVNWGKSLFIEIKEISKDMCNSNLMHLNIVPNEIEWGIPVNNVIIDVYATDIKMFTIAWKALEQELIVNLIKADLIQLNGYYQYVPKIRCECILNKEFPYKEIMESIVAGENVKSIITSKKLCSAWRVAPNKIIEIAGFLRRLGYEIRNHNTNPQIAEGDWLIPYAFPTLSPLSVQLRKMV